MREAAARLTKAGSKLSKFIAFKLCLLFSIEYSCRLDSAVNGDDHVCVAACDPDKVAESDNQRVVFAKAATQASM